MHQLKKKIYENRIEYVLMGDYYVPSLKLLEEKRSIGIMEDYTENICDRRSRWYLMN